MTNPFTPLIDGVFYFPSSREPLSSDVFLIETGGNPVLFDVGNGTAALSADLSVPEPFVILSHFHADHIGNADALSPLRLYLTKETQKHTKPGTVVTEPLSIANGVTVHPFPNSHAKGSLALRAGSLLFIGDALYPREMNGKACYNTGLLKEEIELIKKLNPSQVVVSHRRRPVINASAAVAFLEKIYRMRDPIETYIRIDPVDFDMKE